MRGHRGFQAGADYLCPWAWLQLRGDEPGRVMRDWRTNFNAWVVLDYGGLWLDRGWNVNLQGRFLNYWWGVVGGGFNDSLWRVGALRGGPALRGLRRWFGWTHLNTDSRKPVYVKLGASGRLPDVGDSWQLTVTSSVVVQALSNLELTVGPVLRRTVEDLQYVDEVEDASGRARVVLGRLDQTTAELVLRASYTFFPGLSLQVYAQALASSGGYPYYHEAVDPRADDYAARFARLLATRDGSAERLAVGTGADALAFEPADYDERALRSNVVLRWEYSPGSALFVVWSHARTSEGDDGVFDLGDELSELVSAPGEHAVLLKLSHWLGI